MTVVMSNGIMMAVPLACTMRPSSSTSRPGASAAIRVPVLKSVIAEMNTGRVWRRWMRKPVIGMTTAIVSMNAVVSHCAAVAVMLRSFMRCGKATPMIVSFKITTNADTSSSRITSWLRLASG
jgi:hypothetical protein